MRLTFRAAAGALILAGAAAVAGLNPAGAQQPPGNALVPSSPASGPQLLDYAIGLGGAVWLKGTARAAELWHAPSGGRPVVIASGPEWHDVALGPEAAWVFQRTGAVSRLLRVPLQANATPTQAFAGPERADGLFAEGERLYWVEAAAGPQPGFSFVPVVAPTVRLRVRETTGQVRTVAGWPGGELPSGGAGEVIGTAEGAVYVRHDRLTSTEFLRVHPDSGEWDRVAAEQGVQQGLLHDGVLYWTAESEEANSAGVYCVRRQRPDGEPALLTDWLPNRGALREAGGRVYYVADAIYRLPDRLAPPERLRSVPWFDAFENDVPVIVREPLF